MYKQTTPKTYKTAALAICAFLALVTSACLLYLWAAGNRAERFQAEIYQDGRLLWTIPLDQVEAAYILEVTDSKGCRNRIEVRPGSIGVIWADCPDKLCVNQGFIHRPVLPIACLPNRLVIRLCPSEDSPADASAPDAVAY